jgi:hypothetical protein
MRAAGWVCHARAGSSNYPSGVFLFDAARRCLILMGRRLRAAALGRSSRRRGRLRGKRPGLRRSLILIARKIRGELASGETPPPSPTETD